MTIASREPRRVAIILTAGSFLLVRLCFLFLPRVFVPWNAQVTDQLFQFRAAFANLQPPYDATIVHVDLNDTSLQQLSNFYLKRIDYARVIRSLAALRVSAQLYDFIFAAPSREEDDQELIDATGAAGNVYYGLAFRFVNEESPPRHVALPGEVTNYLRQTAWQVRVRGDARDWPRGTDPLITFPALSAASRGLGFLSVRPDRDGVFRRVPLLVRYEDAFYPSFPFRALCDYLEVPPERILLHPGKSILLEGAHAPGQPARNIEIPVDRGGNLVVNFVGAWERMKHYHFADVHRLGEDREELELWKEELSGKIVIVADVSTGASDAGPIPTDVEFPLSGLHASVLNTVLTENFLREWSDRQMLPIELAILACLALLAWKVSARRFVVGSLLLALSYAGIAAWALFFTNTILQIVRPLLLVLFGSLAVSAQRYMHEEKQKEVLRRTLEAYFPPSVVRRIVANPGMLATSGQKKELTILFSDICGFTSLSAGLPADRIQRLLNEYFEAMVDIVFRYGGTVDKYIGDGLMVFFGDPEVQSDHAERCVQAAIAMQRRARELNAMWLQEGGIPLEIRVGVNTGVVVVGNMGSARRLSYTVLGSAVNLAQRLEASAPPGEILIAQRTRDLACGRFAIRALGGIAVKGFEEAVAVYQVLVDQEGSGERVR